MPKAPVDPRLDPDAHHRGAQPTPPGVSLTGLAARAGFLRRSEADQRWQAFFDATSEGLLLCDARGTVLAANTAAAGLVAQVPSAMAGQPLTRWVEQPPAPGRGPFPVAAGEAALRQAHGPARPVDLRLLPLPAYGGTPAGSADAGQWLVAVRDNTDRRRAAERLNFLANYDSLTGLPNRALFRDRLAQAMARAQRSRRTMALMFMDLDRFKLVNDGLGHEVGDSLLKHVAQKLTNSLRDVDSVSRQVDSEPCVLSRLGGDEFTVIAENIGGAEDATHIACRLLDALQVPIKIGNEEVVVSASIGISLFPTDDVDLDGLIKHTDMAMYRSKSMGRGTYSFFSDELNAAMSARLSLEGSLRRATERHEFVLFYQPKADLATGEVTGVEALLRWQCPKQGLVPPDKFIGVLEDTGMILPVGAWVIRTACEQLAAWDKMRLPKLRMAVNLSARQFRHLYLASMIQDTLAENGIEASRLEIELTESLLMEDSESNRNMLDSFSKMGVRLAIDDFGTGHSSLSYLKRFNIDTLKVDRSFVSSLPDSGEDKAIATAVIALARSLEMSVVAEGVETLAQAAMLKDLGCDEMQGYLLSRPLPAPAFVDWLKLRLREEQQRRLGLASGPGENLPRMTLTLPGD